VVCVEEYNGTALPAGIHTIKRGWKNSNSSDIIEKRRLPIAR
jgi:hypothetical protein